MKANIGLDFYRIKTKWTKELDGGELSKSKTEELVLASNYTEAEKLAYAIIEDQSRTQFGNVNIEITKTKINDVLFNDILKQEEYTTCGHVINYFEESEESGVGLYMVKVILFALDEKTDKNKRSTEIFFVPATSNYDATQRIELELRRAMVEFVIRDTKFDKAEAIYWPTDVHQQKVKEFDLQS